MHFNSGTLLAGVMARGARAQLLTIVYFALLTVILVHLYTLLKLKLSFDFELIKLKSSLTTVLLRNRVEPETAKMVVELMEEKPLSERFYEKLVEIIANHQTLDVNDLLLMSIRSLFKEQPILATPDNSVFYSIQKAYGSRYKGNADFSNVRWDCIRARCTEDMNPFSLVACFVFDFFEASPAELNKSALQKQPISALEADEESYYEKPALIDVPSFIFQEAANRLLPQDASTAVNSYGTCPVLQHELQRLHSDLSMLADNGSLRKDASSVLVEYGLLASSVMLLTKDPFTVLHVNDLLLSLAKHVFFSNQHGGAEKEIQNAIKLLVEKAYANGLLSDARQVVTLLDEIDDRTPIEVSDTLLSSSWILRHELQSLVLWHNRLISYASTLSATRTSAEEPTRTEATA